MANTEQIKRGTAEYIKNDVLPHLPTAKQIGVGIYVALVMDNAAAAVAKLKENPAFEITGVFQGDEIDIDKLYSVAKPQFEQKRTIEIPFVGELTFDGRDIEKLYRYIKES